MRKPSQGEKKTLNNKKELEGIGTRLTTGIAIKEGVWLPGVKEKNLWRKP